MNGSRQGVNAGGGRWPCVGADLPPKMLYQALNGRIRAGEAPLGETAYTKSELMGQEPAADWA